MTDRVKGFTVVLEKDMRIDDVEGLRKSIQNFRGVAEVLPVISEPGSDDIIRHRTVQEAVRKVLKALDDLI